MLAARIRELWRRYTSRSPGVARETQDERAARKYWDKQVDEDHQRRGVDDDHA